MKRKDNGFSTFEILVVIGIIGILAVIITPNIMNTLKTRTLQAVGKELLMDLQKTKVQAIKTKLNHRLRFFQDTDGWAYLIEREDLPTQWSVIQGFVKKDIPVEYTTTVSLPNLCVLYSPMGIVLNFDPTQQSVSFHSPDLAVRTGANITDVVVTVYYGGALNYAEPQEG